MSGKINVVDEASPVKKPPTEEVSSRQALMGNKLQIIRAALGEDLFKKVYEFLRYHR